MNIMSCHWNPSDSSAWTKEMRQPNNQPTLSSLELRHMHIRLILWTTKMMKYRAEWSGGAGSRGWDMTKFNQFGGLKSIVLSQRLYSHTEQRQDPETCSTVRPEERHHQAAHSVLWRNGVCGFGGRQNTWWEVSGKVEAYIHLLISFLITYLKTMNRKKVESGRERLKGQMKY